AASASVRAAQSLLRSRRRRGAGSRTESVPGRHSPLALGCLDLLALERQIREQLLELRRVPRRVHASLHQLQSFDPALELAAFLVERPQLRILRQRRGGSGCTEREYGSDPAVLAIRLRIRASLLVAAVVEQRVLGNHRAGLL